MSPNDTDRDRAGEAPLFLSLSPQERRHLLAGASARDYGIGETVFTEGDPADRFFVVLEGRVNLFALTAAGAQSVIETFEPVTTFAEAAIFGAGIFPLTCEAVEPTRLLHVPAKPFLDHLAADPGVTRRLLAGLALWQAKLYHEIATLKDHSPAVRLAAFLLSLTPVTDGPAQVHLPFPKATLASRIGITPESLSRALARLKPLGVDVQGRDIHILDVSKLRKDAT